MERAKDYEKEKMIEAMHMETMSYQQYIELKARLRNMRIKSLHNADLERAAIEKAMA